MHEITFKKRPFGIKRYAPGKDGLGAVVMDMTEKSRYPGDPQGQAVVAGVQKGWVVRSVNGNDVTKVPFEDLMESLDDEVLDPVEALSLNLKEAGTPFDFKDGSHKVDTSYGAAGEASFVFGGGNIIEAIIFGCLIRGAVGIVRGMITPLQEALPPRFSSLQLPKSPFAELHCRRPSRVLWH